MPRSKTLEDLGETALDATHLGAAMVQHWANWQGCWALTHMVTSSQAAGTL